MNPFLALRFFGVLLIFALLTAIALPAPAVDSATEKKLSELLDRECTSLDKAKLSELIREQLAPVLQQGDPDLFRIMEGVIKRTDFDGIGEEKTAEIIGMVYGAYRKGAPLEYLDELFDVAYVKTVDTDRLVAASKALQEFHRSDVPQGVYEEFVYNALEEEWDPAVIPVLSRGLIYGVERGLTPERLALILMLDVKNGELKKQAPEQVVIGSIKLVREKEPRNWKPLSQAERETAEKQDSLRSLERRQQEVDESLRKQESAMHQAEAQLKELREYPGRKEGNADPEKMHRDLEALIRKLQTEIAQYQAQHGAVTADLERARRDVEQRRTVKDQERRQKREQTIEQTRERIVLSSRQSRLDEPRLFHAVDELIGTPYRFGGDSDRGIDCSAFTRRVYRSQRIELPRNSREQARVTSPVDYTVVRTGDLLFFDTSISGTISHVGISLGKGVFAHASSSKGVTKSSIREKYYVKRFVKGGRVFND
ncbi:MAG: NlpC/P60 family protein [Nitrospiraceae bacterium]|nr:NlpC/P60 family protein [Nitrospiraceae bacterium]